MIKVAVDAMGGDYAPAEMVAGAVQAVNANREISVLLVGQEPAVAEELKKHNFPAEQIQIVPATEIIESWRSGHCRKNQGRGKTSACAVNPH